MELDEIKARVTKLSAYELQQLTDFVNSLAIAKLPVAQKRVPGLGLASGHTYELPGELDEPEQFWDEWLDDDISQDKK